MLNVPLCAIWTLALLSLRLSNVICHECIWHFIVCVVIEINCFVDSILVSRNISKRLFLLSLLDFTNVLSTWILVEWQRNGNKVITLGSVCDRCWCEERKNPKIVSVHQVYFSINFLWFRGIIFFFLFVHDEYSFDGWFYLEEDMVCREDLIWIFKIRFDVYLVNATGEWAESDLVWSVSVNVRRVAGK